MIPEDNDYYDSIGTIGWPAVHENMSEHRYKFQFWYSAAGIVFESTTKIGINRFHNAMVRILINNFFQNIDSHSYLEIF